MFAQGIHVTPEMAHELIARLRCARCLGPAVTACCARCTHQILSGCPGEGMQLAHTRSRPQSDSVSSTPSKASASLVEQLPAAQGEALLMSLQRQPAPLEPCPGIRCHVQGEWRGVCGGAVRGRRAAGPPGIPPRGRGRRGGGWAARCRACRAAGPGVRAASLLAVEGTHAPRPAWLCLVCTLPKQVGMPP